MYSPKELEGEVDHSFFDSDCDTNGLEGSEDGRLNKQKTSERQEERTRKETHVSVDRIGGEVQSGRNSEDRRLVDASDQQGMSRLSKDAKYEEQRSSDVYFKGPSPLPSANHSETLKNSQSDEGSSVHSNSSDEERELDEDFKLRKTSGNVNDDDDDDGYHRSNDESEEDVRSPVMKSSKHKGLSHGTPKKSAGKFLKLSRSHSSSSDTESSHSSEERVSCQSQKSPVKHQRVGSANQKESAESEDTVTDVTPLSTPNISPSQSIDVAAGVQQQLQQPSVAEEMIANDISDGQGSISSEGEDGPVFLKVEKELDRALVVPSPGSVCGSRKNYSFTNEEVREIDRENQRLLRELSRASARSRSGNSTCSKTSSRRTSAPPVRLYHSALNRQREQERIQKENLAFLKRLESVKPTPGMTRDEQLADYQQQCRYMGTQATAIAPVKPRSSKTSGRTSRPGSSPRKARPETTKLNRPAPRPAWS